MGIVSELEGLGAPRNVVDAGKELEVSCRSGKRPSRELMDFVRSWLVRNSYSQNRWGK